MIIRVTRLLQLGNTLVFLFDLIGRNPRVQAKLYEESCSLAPPGCDLTTEDLRKAKYLRACITESFRYASFSPIAFGGLVVDQPRFFFKKYFTFLRLE